MLWIYKFIGKGTKWNISWSNGEETWNLNLNQESLESPGSLLEMQMDDGRRSDLSCKHTMQFTDNVL